MTIRTLLAALSMAVALGAPAGAAECAKSQVDLGPLTKTMGTGRFVSYQPTSLKVIGGRLTEANDASIRDDLRTLRPYFDGLITYGALNGAERIPDIAASLGFRSVVVGVWDPADSTELDNAIAAWKRNPSTVVGISLGNEIVFGKRGGWTTLTRFISMVRTRAPQLALTATEPFAQFLDESGAKAVLGQIDFMLVNIHPVFEPWFKTAPPFNWAQFIVRVTDRLADAFCGPILVKETGVPTAPASLGYSEEKQRAFYRELETQMVPSATAAFAYFSAFDAPWLVDAPTPVPGPHPEEAFWGLFTDGRTAKLAVTGLTPLRTGAPK
jgi:exo-beta-1,3-glucanase (GH17 family)